VKNVPLKTLKENLAYWAEEASKGERVQVTKYNRPYVVLGPYEGSGLYCGSKAGREPLKSVLSQATRGKWLKVLQEDRDEDA
jgi:antitoxin (DNA-binding transcriptional repressor) of toxin-antitoxin stability system